MDASFRTTLYVTVFLTGAAVLVLEVTAVRLLTPYFGSSLFVLSSVLSIILAALSAGYYAGGKLSDRMPAHEPLYVLITWSGVCTLFALLLSLWILPTVSPSFSHISGPIFFAFIFFFLPAFLLGIVSPYIIKLQSLHVPEDRVGSVVGATFFWGTFGSIVGSLGSGFVLIPLLGVTKSIVYTALVLLLVGILGNAVLTRILGTKERESYGVRLSWKYYGVLFIVCVAFFYAIHNTRTEDDRTVLLRTDGLYSQILVYETELNGRTVRALQRDLNNSSASYVGSDDLIFEYSQFAEFYKTLVPDAETFLLLGGGAYSIPRTLAARNPELKIDAVEIEPSLYEVAKTYFGLTETDQVTNHIIDARVFLQSTDKKFDVIFQDVVSTDMSIPQHLATVEYFTEVKEHLPEDGAFIMNYIGMLSEETPTLTGSLYKTIGQIFPNVAVYPIRTHEAERIQNIVFVAKKDGSKIDLSDNHIVDRQNNFKDVTALRLPEHSFDVTDELFFTDDHAPIEYLMMKQL